MESLGSAKNKKIAANTAYTIGGALVLNDVLQLLVYPRLAASLGARRNGTVLYIMALVNIMGPSVGQALNNSRLILRRDMPVVNGDYNLAVLIYTALGTAGAFLFTGITSPGTFGTAAGAVLTAALILFTVFRYYGDVEYRLSLDYRRYFIYYVLCSAGYAGGFVLYLVSGKWMAVFLAGEILALCYVAATGTIFRNFFARSECFGPVMKKGGLLVLSYFVTNLTLNIDRLYLNNTLGGEAVTVYYVVSLIGKTLVLFIAPINTVVISYLTRENARLDRRRFIRFSAVGVFAAAVFFVLTRIATPIFIRIFYPALADQSGPLVTVVSISQILAMLSAYLFIIALTFTGERWQLALQTLHLGVLVLLITLMTPGGGLYGFSTAVLLANLIRVLLVLILGIWKGGSPCRAEK